MWEDPDILWMKSGPSVDLAGIQWSLGIYEQLAKEMGPYFLVCNVTGSTLEPQARSLAVKQLNPRWFKGICYVGAGMFQKIITKSLKVAVLFTDRQGLNDAFADSEEQARAWIAEQRRLLLEGKPRATPRPSRPAVR